MLRAHRQAGEAEPAQDLADRTLVQLDAEAARDDGLQVDAAPAHHPMPGQVRTGLDPAFQLGLLRRREPRLRTRAARPIGQAGQPSAL